MKLRSIATVLAIALASAAAYAQSGVYVTFDAQQFTRTGIYANPGPHGNVDKPWLFGPSYGVYYDVTHLPKLGKLNTGPLVFGIDARGDVYRDSIYGSQIDREDGIFSLRAATKRAFWQTTPFVEGGFGIGHRRVGGLADDLLGGRVENLVGAVAGVDPFAPDQELRLVLGDRASHGVSPVLVEVVLNAMRWVGAAMRPARSGPARVRARGLRRPRPRCPRSRCRCRTATGCRAGCRWAGRRPPSRPR